MYNVSFSRFVGTLDGSIHFSSDDEVDETEDGAHPRGKPDFEGIAMTNLAHRRFSSDPAARLALKQQGLEFHTVDP